MIITPDGTAKRKGVVLGDDVACLKQTGSQFFQLLPHLLLYVLQPVALFISQFQLLKTQGQVVKVSIIQGQTTKIIATQGQAVKVIMKEALCFIRH